MLNRLLATPLARRLWRWHPWLLAGLWGLVQAAFLLRYPFLPEPGKDLDTKQLIGKHLSVEVSDHSYADPATGNERTIRQATGFRAA